MEDLKGATGTVRYEIVGQDNVSDEAESLHQQGREAGARGDYKKAISLLQRASDLAPQWPYPIYDLAYTHLLMKDFDGARTYYQKTVELRPRGFFTAITAVDSLTREQKGDLPVGTYLAYISLEWVSDPAQRAQAIRRLAKRVPQFAPAWKELASITEDDNERLSAIEKGLAANPDAETRGMLVLNKALVLNLKGDHNTAVRLLGELALDPNSTFGTEHSAKAALALIMAEK